MKADRPPCRKCLIESLDEDDFIRSLKEYIAAYPAEKRVDDDEYRRRLSLCRGCERLENGMCALCGCYVELRALKKGMGCPDTPDRWGSGTN